MFPDLFQLLAAAHIPKLVAPSSIGKGSNSGPYPFFKSCLTLTLTACILFHTSDQLTGNLNSILSHNTIFMDSGEQDMDSGGMLLLC
jgi:hypothetical protein